MNKFFILCVFLLSSESRLSGLSAASIERIPNITPFTKILCENAKNGNLSWFTKANLFAMPLDDVDEYDKRPLDYAAENGHLDVVKVLLMNDANNHATLEKRRGVRPSYPPVELACRGGYCEMLKLFASLGEHVRNEIKKQLEEVIENGNTRCMRLILDHYDKNNFNDRYRCKEALFLATRVGCYDGVRELVEWGVPVNSVNSEGETPLHCASKRRLVTIVQLLLALGADLGIKDRQGNTPLHDAIKSPTVVEQGGMAIDAPSTQCVQLLADTSYKIFTRRLAAAQASYNSFARKVFYSTAASTPCFDMNLFYLLEKNRGVEVCDDPRYKRARLHEVPTHADGTIGNLFLSLEVIQPLYDDLVKKLGELDELPLSKGWWNLLRILDQRWNAENSQVNSSLHSQDLMREVPSMDYVLYKIGQYFAGIIENPATPEFFCNILDPRSVVGRYGRAVQEIIGRSKVLRPRRLPRTRGLPGNSADPQSQSLTTGTRDKKRGFSQMILETRST